MALTECEFLHTYMNNNNIRKHGHQFKDKQGGGVWKALEEGKKRDE